MRPVVEEWDCALRAEVPAYARLVPEAEVRGSILRPESSEESVAKAEARLGIRFPPSYRSFLRIANGADAGRFGADTFERLVPADPNGLLRVEDIVFLAEADPNLVSMWQGAMRELADRQSEPSATDPTPVMDFGPGLKGLLITRPVQYGIVALVPFPGEWQVWEFDHSDVQAHQSFAAFLQNKTHWAKWRVAQRKESARVATADGRSAIDVWLLAEVGDARAVDAACLALPNVGDPRERDTNLVVGTLISLGDERAIPHLRAALERTTNDRFRFLVLKALDSSGDPGAVQLLRQFIATGSPDASTAQSYLERRETLPRW